jgi:hypothetical protein
MSGARSSAVGARGIGACALVPVIGGCFGAALPAAAPAVDTRANAARVNAANAAAGETAAAHAAAADAAYTPPSTRGASPLGGEPLVVEHTSLEYPAYVCEPGRTPQKYALHASAEEVCVDVTMAAITAAPPNAQDQDGRVTIDGRPVELTIARSSRPVIVATCVGDGSYLRQWAWDLRGCVANDRLVTEDTRVVELQFPSYSPRPYARWEIAATSSQ